MNKKLKFLAGGIALILAGIYFQSHHIMPQVAGISFDRSIKAMEGQPIKVAQVIDGDTIVLINGDHLRYIGIDTPEEFDQRKPVQCFAKEAAEANRKLVEGKTIKFYKDINQFDKYGRWLGFVYLEDGTFVNEELVRSGYAFAYDYVPDISKSGQLRADETYAREHRLGLWSGQCQITTLKGGREQTNAVK
jgi:endonuclease YncB( thermonuclease family)